MTGRQAGLDTLRREQDRAGEGKRCVLVGGEPGIGKTRLASEFAAEAHADGAAVLLGCASAGLAKPYLPFVEAFGHCLEHLPAVALEDPSGEIAELGRLAPQERERLGEPRHPKNSPASEQFALFRAAISLLRLLSREAPLVLVLEDMHWADEGSLLMLQYLIAGRGDFRGLIVATHRPAEVEPDGAFARTVAQLGREPGFSRLDLDRRSISGTERGEPERMRRGSIECRGESWTIALDGREVSLRDGKGVRYLARLLEAPGVEIHAADLQAGVANGAQASSAAVASAAGLSLRGPGGGDAGPVLDEAAKRQYRERITELEAEIEEAEGFNDPERANLARDELEFIGRELAAAVGVGGRDRRAASEAERARVNVTRAIRGALNRIEEHDGALGGQLKAAVKTGTFCCYEPVPGQAVKWEVMGAQP